MNSADRLIERIIKTANPSVIGLDPVITEIPDCYKLGREAKDDFVAEAELIFEFNRDIIETVYKYVPAVKPQSAFYEKYGSAGIKALEKTAAYAKSKNLIVIEDAKRNDIGNTANAYAEAHLGKVCLINGETVPSIQSDFLTVTPFLGSDGVEPFIKACELHKKGVFVLVRTSNKSAFEIQDALTDKGITVSEALAEYVSAVSERCVGKSGYSSVGAVVGATYPEQARALRKIMPKSIFLVPGYGAQGGSAKDVLPCFNEDGLGAIVNSSRGILYSHTSVNERKTVTKEEYLKKVKNAVLTMKGEIYGALKSEYPNIIY